MLPDDFYIKRNLTSKYGEGKVPHYPIMRDSFFALDVRPYTLKEGEDFFTLASAIFGSDSGDLYTLLADINPTKHLDDWGTGDIVFIPSQVVRNSRFSNDEPTQLPVIKTRWKDREIPADTVDVPVCGIPVFSAADDITPSTIKYNWGSVEGAQYYVYQWKKTSEIDWSNEQITFGTSVLLTNLSLGVDYSFRVKSVCIYGGMSSFQVTNAVTSNYPSCSAVGVLVSSEQGPDFIKYSFTAVDQNEPSVGYEVQYKKAVDLVFNSIFISTKNFTISGLEAGTDYEVKVRRKCSAFGSVYYSGFSNTITVSTTSVCAPVSNLKLENSTGNALTFSWISGSGNTNAIARVKDLFGNTISINENATSPCTLSGLQAFKKYIIEVESVCGSVLGNKVAIEATTTVSICLKPTILLVEELGGVVEGGVKKRVIHVVVQSSTSSQHRYYVNDVLVLTSNFVDVTLKVDDNTWALTTLTIKVDTMCSAYSISAADSMEVELTKNDPTAVSCAVPGATIQNVTSEGFDVAFTPSGGNVTEMEISYKVIGTDDSTYVVLSGILPTQSPKSITGLISGATYVVRVRALCGATYSNYVTQNVSIDPALVVIGGEECPLVTFMSISSVQSNSALVKFTPSTNVLKVTGYKVRWTRRSDGVQIESDLLPQNASSYLITGLTTNTIYDVDIKTFCTGGDESPYTSTVPVQTTQAAGGGGGGTLNFT